MFARYFICSYIHFFSYYNYATTLTEINTSISSIGGATSVILPTSKMENSKVVNIPPPRKKVSSPFGSLLIKLWCQKLSVRFLIHCISKQIECFWWISRLVTVRALKNARPVCQRFQFHLTHIRLRWNQACVIHLVKQAEEIGKFVVFLLSLWYTNFYTHYLIIPSSVRKISYFFEATHRRVNRGVSSFSRDLPIAQNLGRLSTGSF